MPRTGGVPSLAYAWWPVPGPGRVHGKAAWWLAHEECAPKQESVEAASLCRNDEGIARLSINLSNPLLIDPKSDALSIDLRAPLLLYSTITSQIVNFPRDTA